MGKKDKFDLTGHLVRFIWYVFLGTATIQVIEHIKAFMVKTPTHQFQGRIIFMSMFNDIEREELATGGRFAMSKKPEHEHIATTSRDVGFAAVVGRGQHFVTKPSVLTEDGDLVSICRACTHTRDRREAEPICGIQDDVRIGPVPNVVVTHTYADLTPLRYKFLVISRGQAQHVLQRLDMDDTDLDDVNRPNPDRDILSGRGRLLAEDSLCPQIPTNAPPPTSRSDMTHLSRVSLEPTRAQGDLVRSSESSTNQTRKAPHRYESQNLDCCNSLQTS